ncbi:polysaccharide transporter, PST family/lipopolysaccharide exporter [bacterium A37T11]|nr:polysaccharide transporter, PST family/lipopolysaccharide exporter [bacterium A37T11]
MGNQKVAINGAKWTSVASAINTGASFIQLTILAKLLEPEMFGIVAICNLIINFFHIFANLGFTNSIIYKQETDKKVLSSLFFVSLLLGILIFFAMNAGAASIAIFYKEPQLKDLIHLTSVTFPMVTAGQIHQILLQKELRFRTLAFIDMAGSIIGVVITILLAYNDYGALSLLLGYLISTAIKTLCYFICGSSIFKPLFHFNFWGIKEHLIFAMYNTGHGIVSFFGGNLENIVIGRTIGIKELGFYTIAYQLAIFPISKLNPVILQVTSPIMAKIKDNEGLKRAFLKITDFISYCNFPLLAGLFATAVSIIPLIYGNGWEPTTELIKVLVFVGVCMCIIAPISPIIFSKNKPNIVFMLAIVSILVKLPLIYLGTHYFGLIGIAYSYLISAIIDTMLDFYYLNKLIGQFFKELILNIYKPALFCILMVACVLLYQNLVGINGLINTSAQIIIGGLVYIGLTLKYKISYKELLELKKSM